MKVAVAAWLIGVSMKRILITNDDGIESEGIRRLAQMAVRFGEVVVIAPDAERSGNSHKITIREEIWVKPVDILVRGARAYATSGTPADCVRFGLLNFLPDADVVLSGINRGYNSGSDLQYSATAGAALEAASSRVHAIALSEGFGGGHEVTDAYLEEVLAELLEAPLGYNQIWNVNFPECELEKCKGILRDRAMADNSFYTDRYFATEGEDGTIHLDMKGTYHEEALPGTDVRALIDGYVSIGVVRNLSSM